MNDNKDNERRGDKLEEELHKYLVKYPGEHEIKSTIHMLRAYVPVQKKNNKDRFIHVLQYAFSEISLIRKSYWVISLLLFAIGYVVSITSQSNPVIMLIILAPFPFALGMLEVFKGREEGILELEMTCKYSAYEIMLSRLLLIGLYNVSLNVVLTFALLPSMSIQLWEIIALWLTPFILFAAVSLWLSMMFRGNAFVITVISFWITFSFVTLFSDHFLHRYVNAHFGIHVILIIIGLILFCLQIVKLVKTYRSIEGVRPSEINY